MTKAITPFDKTEKYKKQIEPLIKEVIKECSVCQIPFFFSCCIKNDEKHSEYCSDAVTADTHNLVLAKDNFSEYIKTILSYKVDNDQEYEFEDDLPASIAKILNENQEES